MNFSALVFCHLALTENKKNFHILYGLYRWMAGRKNNTQGLWTHSSFNGRHVRGVFHNNNERALELIPQEASTGIYITTYTTWPSYFSLVLFF